MAYTLNDMIYQHDINALNKKIDYSKKLNV